MDKDNQLLEKQGYQILKTIGKGSFGQVFLVYNEQYGVIAAKVVKEEDFNLGEWQTGFRIARGKQNPFVLEYHSANLYGENAIILMGYANIGSLDILIEQKKDIPIPIIRVIMKQLFEGLSMMHEKGFIHRDIKGQNILLHSPTGSGRIVLKIADFGLVKAQKEPQKSTVMSVAGTLPYMASELIFESEDEEDGQVKADEKIDVWASGITLIRPKSLNDDLLWDLLMKLLAFDRKQRISASDALRHPFFTSQKAINEISPQAIQLANQAQMAQQQGDKSMTRFDTEASLQLPYTDVQQFLNNDPEIEMARIRKQLPTKIDSRVMPDPVIHASMLGKEQQQISLPYIQPVVPKQQITPPPYQQQITLPVIPKQQTPQPPIKQQSPSTISSQELEDKYEACIECDSCHKQIKFSEYQDHFDAHLAQQPITAPKLVAVPYTPIKYQNSHSPPPNQKITPPQIKQQITPPYNPQQPIIALQTTPLIAPRNAAPPVVQQQQSPSTISSQEQDNDLELIECDSCHKKIKFSDYQNHFNEHLTQQRQQQEQIRQNPTIPQTPIDARNSPPPVIPLQISSPKVPQTKLTTNLPPALHYTYKTAQI
ncbi:MAG: putative STE family protein kinase [Streblomastix strix]|uniref:non-specific serine/threonine protein kinase n=1 Tax=Streblomastix strix TaxID=222440 RepID=A0A5J4UZH4_9EUKA|nr:MAG: putative STE family protein kinase [Streblomastix strix]